MTVRVGTFEIVHNIPSPYRLHLFECMRQALARRGLILKVHLMARSHLDRAHWAGAPRDSEQTLRFWRDWGPRARGKEWHLNPGLVAHLNRTPPEYLLVGGPWDSLTGPLVSLLTRARVSVAWFEGNTRTPGNLGSVARVVKRGLLERFDLLAVPGSEGVKYAGMIAGQVADRVVVLPNIVDERRFRQPCSDRFEVRARLGASDGDRLLIWPARLIPAKGIEPFLKQVVPGDLVGIRIVILGDGPLRGSVERVIAERGLGDRVALHRPCGYEEMPRVYRAADGFLLPSVHDPNPLSVVEAMHSGLPIIVSERIGNFPEALLEGVNGWRIIPGSRESIGHALACVAGCTHSQLRGMGERSAEIAADFWDSERAIEAFVARVTAHT